MPLPLPKIMGAGCWSFFSVDSKSRGTHKKKIKNFLKNLFLFTIRFSLVFGVNLSIGLLYFKCVFAQSL